MTSILEDGIVLDVLQTSELLSPLSIVDISVERSCPAFSFYHKHASITDKNMIDLRGVSLSCWDEEVVDKGVAISEKNLTRTVEQESHSFLSQPAMHARFVPAIITESEDSENDSSQQCVEHGESIVRNRESRITSITER